MHATTDLPAVTNAPVPNPVAERVPAHDRVARLLRTAFLSVIAVSVVTAIGSMAWAQYQNHLFLTGQHPSQQAAQRAPANPGARTLPATQAEPTGDNPGVVSLFAV